MRWVLRTAGAVCRSRRCRLGLLLGLLVLALNARYAACFGITVYQRYISPYKGWHCAHAQCYGGLSCSEYGKRAIAAHGVVAGWMLIQDRFQECSAAADRARAGAIQYADQNECLQGCFDKTCGSFAKGVCQGCTQKK